MTILYMIHATYNSGGMERILTAKANHLSTSDDVYIATTEQFGKNNFYSLAPNIVRYDFDIGFFDYAEKNIFFKFFSFIKKIKQYKIKTIALIKELKPDLIISLGGHEINFLYKIVKKICPVIVEYHFSHDFHVQVCRNYNFLIRVLSLLRVQYERSLFKKYNKLVVLTETDQKEWRLSNCVTIPNFFDPPKSKKSVKREKVCIAVGRLVEQKNFLELIHIWRLIHEQHSDWSLHIFGDGEQRQSIVDLIHENHLQDSVVLEGISKNIWEEYQKASIFLMTSIYEGFPMVLLEAQAAGLPIVAYDCKSGPKEIIVPGSGYIIPEHDKNCFVSKLSLIMNDENLRCSMMDVAKRNSLNYTQDSVMNQWLSLIKNIKN